MASVTIPVNELTPFDLPPICVLTGDTENVSFRPVKFAWYPRWISAFAMIPIVAVILAAILTRRVKGQLPISDRAWPGYRAAPALVVLAVVSTLVLLGGGIALVDSSPVLGVACLIAAVASPIALSLLFIRGRRVYCSRIDDGKVTLRIPSQKAALAISEHLSGGSRLPAAAAQAQARAGVA